ncbi:TRAP transporter large permease [Acuticoccus sp. I52.16.1]|uniref:TRAP transporter large permease n=1 Tax=Acuticoccus sp. I52.16.1 TaxID=2928472 RepID=UPI001FD12A7D|nr:TRAP transporter large permease subunit [Acuticoccus sp. I52.16.1]UOM35161.1 TRAP transporter large permease subunit [Acuticoccus sp. I52.16.1]
MISIAILVALFLLLLTGIPVAFVLGGLGIILLALGGFSPLMAPAGLLSAMDSFVLVAVPLFLLMANVMLKGGVGRDLFAALQAWVGHLPGGLAVATILSCGVFAAISGSSVATAATIGTVAIPEMTSRGYPRHFTFGVLAAGGTLGILIPPSLIMIIYGVITEESVLALFIAGVGPGLIMIVLFIIYSILYARTQPQLERVEKATWAERRQTGVRAFPTILLSGLVITGIYRGWYTPTEAAAIGFAGALFVTGIVLRTLTLRALWEATVMSMRTTVAILLIVAGAKVFGKAIALYRIPQDVSSFIIDTIASPSLFIMAVAVVLLIMGLVMESLSLLLIMVPVLAGALIPLGIDPIWFGVFFVIMVECALITPPVGLNLYVIQAVGNGTLTEVSRGILPFLALMLLTVLAITVFPQLALWLPFNL